MENENRESSPGDPHPVFKTEPNYAGLFRVFQYSLPSRYPNEKLVITDGPTFQNEQLSINPNRVFGQHKHPPDAPDEFPDFSTSDPPPALSINESAFAPFDSISEYLLVNWGYSHQRITGPAVNSLVRTVLKNPLFSVDELAPNFDFQRSARKLDELTKKKSPNLSSSLPFVSAAPDVWHKGIVNVPMPKAGVKHPSEADFPQLTLTEAWHRKPLDAIIHSFQEPDFLDYHLKPFKLFHKHRDGRIERLYGETYTSNRAWEIEQEVYKKFPPSVPGKPLRERVIVWIMLWSDSTHLAQFGTASLWPIYMYIGNLSKYVRVRPSAYAAHHLAYLPSVSVLTQFICNAS
jgi:Plavaka transposase